MTPAEALQRVTALQPSDGGNGGGDCGNCTAELALVKVRDEERARQRADEEQAVNTDRLADALQQTGLQLQGLHTVASNLQMAVDSYIARVGKLEASVAEIKNVKWWLVAIFGAWQVYQQSGLSGVVAQAVKAMQ